MMIRRTFLACLAATLCGGLAQASDTDDFTRLDLDQDGKLSATEFAKLAAERGNRGGGRRAGGSGDRFSKADTDGDGFLSPSEFAAARAQRGSRDRS